MSELKNAGPVSGETIETESAVVQGPRLESDKAVLHQFGYAQQLLRDMGGFSNFAISFSIISILTGAVTLYGTGLNSGGPVVMGIGWPLVTLFVLFIAASMGELASAIPTSGALYHWSSLLGGPTWGWLTAWLNLIGLVAAIAGIDYGCATFLAPLLKPTFGLGAWFGSGSEIRSYMIVFTVLLLSHAILNHIGIRTVARLNDFSALYHIGGVLVVVIALAFWAPKQPLSYLFTKTYVSPDLASKPFWFIFLGGLLQAQWTYTGYDASAHTIEETKDARVRAPWGIYLSVAISGLFGYIMLTFITLAIKDLPAAAAASNPIQYIFEQAINPRLAAAIIWIMTLAQWFCGLSCVTSTSRMIFAFSRDNGMPLARVWANVSRRYRTPAAAVWLASVLAFLLPCLILAVVTLRPKDLDFGKLYPAVTGISTIGLYLSYGLPIFLKLRATREGVWDQRANGPWSLGNWSVPVACISVLWIAFITVLFVLPPNALTGYIFGGTLVALLILYFAAVRGRFRGPVPQAKSQEELLRIEAEYEH
ncbi:MAG TPA: amino acid permease [Chthonomonadaceae bacterium]|nr:amino acid permease [Chthonomonadaceae bacterium]